MKHLTLLSSSILVLAMISSLAGCSSSEDPFFPSQPINPDEQMTEMLDAQRKTGWHIFQQLSCDNA